MFDMWRIARTQAANPAPSEKRPISGPIAAGFHTIYARREL